MKLKVSELTTDQLDWAVTKCEGGSAQSPGELTDDEYYSTEWTLGGPIIEREGISVICHTSGNHWAARTKEYGAIYIEGPTPLIAAMRCYVVSKMGEEVDVPDELGVRE